MIQDTHVVDSFTFSMYWQFVLSFFSFFCWFFTILCWFSLIKLFNGIELRLLPQIAYTTHTPRYMIFVFFSGFWPMMRGWLRVNRIPISTFYYTQLSLLVMSLHIIILVLAYSLLAFHLFERRKNGNFEREINTSEGCKNCTISDCCMSNKLHAFRSSK